MFENKLSPCILVLTNTDSEYLSTDILLFNYQVWCVFYKFHRSTNTNSTKLSFTYICNRYQHIFYRAQVLNPGTTCIIISTCRLFTVHLCSVL